MGITQNRTDSQDGKSEKKYDNLLDYFDFYLFPFALKIGMTYEQFWEDDPQLFYSYLEAYNMKVEEQMIYDNQMAFIQSQYNLLALQQVLQFSKNPKKIFPDKPFDLLGNRVKEEKSPLDWQEERKAKMKMLSTMFKKNRR